MNKILNVEQDNLLGPPGFSLSYSTILLVSLDGILAEGLLSK